MLDINALIAKELTIKPTQVSASVELIDQGYTIPFISRYRKEVTGSLNDEILRNLNDRLTYYRNLEERKITVLKTIEEQGKLSDELKEQIENCLTQVALEDIYRPYKPKRKTRGTIGIEKGCEPFANAIVLNAVTNLQEDAKAYLNEDKEVSSVEKVLQYTSDILAERYNDDQDIHASMRKLYAKSAHLVCSLKGEDDDEIYKVYYEFDQPINKLQGYQILAIDRGEKQGVLSVKVSSDDQANLEWMNQHIIHQKNSQVIEFLKSVILDSYSRLLAPSIERDIRNELTENAQEGAMGVFKANLKQLLLAQPLANQTVLGWDPAFRTGCKLAVVDPTGKVLDTKVIFVTEPASKTQIEKGINDVIALINKFNITLISCGNGTASRESEAIITEIIRRCGKDVKYVITNEAGASVYSASKLATEEFPKFDVGQRSATSIARRVQDPLAELVKIDPKSIGVGQYQHDMNQKRLSETLDGVVEDCVNSVGVDLNTASYSLLEHISGISHTLAKNIVAYREENGSFTQRNQLLKVAKLGPKAYELAAGFLRIRNGKDILDNTGVHPESYSVAREVINQLSLEDIFASGDAQKAAIAKINFLLSNDKMIKDLAKKCNVGEPTLVDILKEISHPGRDPREDAPAPILRADVLKMEDLTPGMKLKGTVRNITDFGAFVDIGVHQDGLVHKSKMSKRFVKNPLDIVKLNDIVEVTVLEVDLKRKRIQLSMVEK